MQKVFNYIEELRISLREWITAFVSIVFIRTFLENFSGAPAFDTLMSTQTMFVHFYLFYISIVLGIILILRFFTKIEIQKVSNVVLFGILLILTPPIIDIITTKGAGIPLGYFITNSTTFVHDYFTFIVFGLPGISLGIRLEFICMLVLTYIYVCRYSGHFRAIAASVSVYTLFFVYYTLPSFLQISTSYLWITFSKGSLFIHESARLPYTLQAYFDLAISHAFYISTVVFGIIYAYTLHKNTCIALLKNSRIERVAHYFAMIILGAIFSLLIGTPVTELRSWLDITTIIILFFAFYATWMHAVLINDIADIQSDALSNKNRPLVTGKLDSTQAKNYALIFLILAVVGGYLVGHHTLPMIVLFIALSYVYSTAPFHLKRFPIINPLIIGLASLSAVLAGFYTVNIDQEIHALPLRIILLVVITIALMSNIKDIKDIEGDRAVGVYTLPVLFGLEKGKKVIAILVVLALATVPLLSGQAILWYPFVPFAIWAYYLITRENFKEIHLFFLYFAYLCTCIGLLVL